MLTQYLNRVRPKPALEAEARFHVAPGRQVQIDWGEMGPVSINGITTKVHAFIAVLAWSRTLESIVGEQVAGILRYIRAKQMADSRPSAMQPSLIHR